MRADALYPLRTERRLAEPIWGGKRLASWLALPEPRPASLGESWQIYEQNLITNGPLAGRTLGEVAQEAGVALVGTRSAERYGADVPLLAKFIDAGDRLSIQVHPDDEYAHSHEAASGFHGKTEAWYILDAPPGASVTYGLVRSSSREEFAAAVQAGNVESLLAQLPVAPGDVIFVPAGTLHAINAGIMLFEIQQKSDLTYRVYDYGRRDAATGQLRELHLDKALAVSDFGVAQQGRVISLALGPKRDLMIGCSFFALERWRVDQLTRFPVDPGSLEILTVIDGEGSLAWAGSRGDELELQRGDSLLLPATLQGCTLQGELTLLRVYIPDRDALADEARAAGHNERRISEVVCP